jgi:hypothetical protein
VGDTLQVTAGVLSKLAHSYAIHVLHRSTWDLA